MCTFKFLCKSYKTQFQWGDLKFQYNSQSSANSVKVFKKDLILILKYYFKRCSINFTFTVSLI